MNLDAGSCRRISTSRKLTPEFYANPYPTYRALRENEPVKRLPNGSYFLTRYDDLVAAYKNTKAFSLRQEEGVRAEIRRLACSSSTTPPASSSTIPPPTPGCGG